MDKTSHSLFNASASMTSQGVDYFIQFLYLKTYVRPTVSKKPEKHTVYFICIFALFYLFVLLLRLFVLIFIIFIWRYTFFPKHSTYEPYRNPDSKTMITMSNMNRYTPTLYSTFKVSVKLHSQHSGFVIWFIS